MGIKELGNGIVVKSILDKYVNPMHINSASSTSKSIVFSYSDLSSLVLHLTAS